MSAPLFEIIARDFVRREFVDRGMIADLNVHRDIGTDGEPKPHAHVMLTMRQVGEDGFGAKVREWTLVTVPLATAERPKPRASTMRQFSITAMLTRGTRK